MAAWPARPPGLHDSRLHDASICTAVEPATGNDVRVLPTVSTSTMAVFLRGLGEQLAPDVHAALVVDAAGWHVADARQVSHNVTLVTLPPDASQSKPAERGWLSLR